MATRHSGVNFFAGLLSGSDNSWAHQTLSTAGWIILCRMVRGSRRNMLKPNLFVKNHGGLTGCSSQITATFRFWPSGGNGTRRRTPECGARTTAWPGLVKDAGGAELVMLPGGSSLNSYATMKLALYPPQPSGLVLVLPVMASR